MPGLDSWVTRVALLLVVAGVGLRIVSASRAGLWADEIFSLAMATGHSLEHPAATADPELGDFAEPRDAVPSATLGRYLEQETPPAGPRRVVRAALLSDTSPPLYYLLLDPWTRLFGTGDWALRLFSVACAVASLPLIWLLGLEVGDRRTAWSAAALFSLSPAALFYSAEGRMYALLWLMSLALAWSSVRLSRDESSVRDHALWVAAGVAGLLTHYFFAFVWLGCAGWLVLETRGRQRRTVALLAGLTLLAVSPWYAEVPASLASWRVTEGWLDGDLRWPGALALPLTLAGRMLSGGAYMGGRTRADLVVWAAVATLAGALLARRRFGTLFTEGRSLLWAWAAAACTGPLVFDMLRHATTTGVPRYALPALPALLLLVSAGLGRVGPALRIGLAAALLSAWLPGILDVTVTESPRPWQPYPEMARRLEARLDPGDIVIVSSIPSGVLGIARYLDDDIPIASWVEQLGTRGATDAERLTAGRRRVALAEVTHLGRGSTAREWLEAHGRQVARDTFPSSSSEILYFVPASGEAFGTGSEN